MPCFKGIAVSIHANGAPISEYGIQKQSRASRISSYIPVPHPKLSPESNKPEPAHFAISITLLTPGLAIPYSTPKPTPGNPRPKPKYVSSSKYPEDGTVAPYVATSGSRKETIAAYIYFDGRAKEEVATLLRPGEETWVNSRWVQVPGSEGGGLAEREFLFREVGLERWLNGLDLEGNETPEKLEKRRQKFERQRQRQQARANGDLSALRGSRDTLRYGADDGAPLEEVFDDSHSSDDDDDDGDDEPPEATGQIKIAMFRVLASGEVKKGEYSPQFDAHDDDDESSAGKTGDVEHTTSFAKPKTLDPSTISTQTVTGIDPPNKPYATFTYFYRGERQLRKLNILPTSKPSHAPHGSAKRRSGQIDFSSLGPLRSGGTVGFSAFRDKDDSWNRRKSRRKSQGGVTGTVDEDSEDDEEDSTILSKLKDAEDKDPSMRLDPSSQGELADGVNRIRLKRAHSAGLDSNATKDNSRSGSPQDSTEAATSAGSGEKSTDIFGSPLKKHRPSLHGPSELATLDANQAHISLGEVLAGGPGTSTNGVGTDMAAPLLPGVSLSTSPTATIGLAASPMAAAVTTTSPSSISPSSTTGPPTSAPTTTPATTATATAPPTEMEEEEEL